MGNRLFQGRAGPLEEMPASCTGNSNDATLVLCQTHWGDLSGDTDAIINIHPCSAPYAPTNNPNKLIDHQAGLG